MIILDTNVISESAKPQSDPVVVSWWAGEPRAKAITAVTLGELLTWVEQQPSERRRRQLFEALSEFIDVAIENQLIFDYDAAAAIHFGSITARRRAMGRPIAASDAMIAAICRSRGVPLATRNVKDFVGTGIELVNPWEPR